MYIYVCFYQHSYTQEKKCTLIIFGKYSMKLYCVACNFPTFHIKKERCGKNER